MVVSVVSVVLDSVDVSLLVVSDVVMPGQRGPELARAFRARCPGRRWSGSDSIL